MTSNGFVMVTAQSENEITVVCRMVQISVHKLQYAGYGWHPWILNPTRPGTHLLYSTNSHGLNFIIFFIIQKSKFTERYNICSNWLLLQSIKGTCFQQMLNISVNFDFCFMKKLWDLAHEKLLNIQGGHHVGTNIHGWQPYLKISIYVLKSANGGLLCRPLYVYCLWN